MKHRYCLGLVLVVTSSLQAGNWPHFRGPTYNGAAEEKGLPVKWSTTDNIAWSADLPGPGANTPVVWDDHVFVSAADLDADTLKVLCFDRKTGKLRWKHDVATGIARKSRSNYASPSATTDGKLAIFFFGNGDLLAFDFAGKQLWRRNIQKEVGPFAFLWTFGSSPLLYDGRLYLQVLQRDVAVGRDGFRDRKNESYLLAMNPKTGKTLWRQIRPSKAQAESRESFASVIPFEAAGRKSLLINGGDALTAHDPATGEEQWRWGTWNPTRIRSWRHVPSPVGNKDVVLVCAPKRDPIYAIKTGGSGRLSDDAVAWVSRDVRELSADVPTPALYDGDFFVLSDVRKALSRIDPKTANVKWTIRTPGQLKYEASPLVADGKVYIVNFDGQVAIIDADDGEILNTVAMHANDDYRIRSTIAAAHGQLFIRMNAKLYCVGKN